MTRTMSPEARLRIGGVQRVCQTCGAGFWTTRSTIARFDNAGRYCSRPCKHEAQRGRTQKGRPRGPVLITRADGYVTQWAPDHPKSHKGRVLQHVIVMEQKLGRPLASGETVHHVNHDRADNRPENLEVLTYAEHNREHARDGGRLAALAAAANRRERDPETGRFM